MTDQQEQQSPATNPSAPPAFEIPEAYRDRGWVEKVKSPDDLWKTLDNAQSLLGKRPAGIPANDAPVEEWEKFKQAARGEYVFSDIEGVPEGMDLAPVKEVAKKLMHDAGVPPKIADELFKQYMALDIEGGKQKQESLDKRYDELATKVLGEKQADFEKAALEVLNTHVDEDLRKSFVDNPDGMIAYIQSINKLQEKHNAELAAVRAEYGAEGKLPNGGERPPAEDISEIVSKLSKLRLSPEAQDFTKPGHKKAMDEIAALQATVARHYNK